MSRRGKDPYVSFRFRLEIDKIQVASFSECTGLQMETSVFEYKEGGNNHTTLKFPEHTAYGNITLKRGITNSNELINWQRDVANGRFNKRPRQESNFSIILLDEKENSAGQLISIDEYHSICKPPSLLYF